MEPNTKHPKFVRWALMLGIVVILNIFFTVVIALAIPAPEYEAYCPYSNAPVPTTKAACEAADATWVPYTGGMDPQAGVKPAPEGYCDTYSKCQKPYEAASEQHALYAFVFMIALAIIALVAGFMPIGSSIVSSGLSYGGVLGLVIASASYWGTAGNWLRLAIATAGLIALLYIGWRQFKD